MDGAAPADQMRAVDRALRMYFAAEDWLKERDDRNPSLRRR
jgi:hypothetical protein